MASKWQRDIWDAKTSTWIINPDYEELEREITFSGVTGNCTPREYRTRIIWNQPSESPPFEYGKSNEVVIVSEFREFRHNTWSNWSSVGGSTIRYLKWKSSGYTSDRGTTGTYARNEDAVYYYREEYQRIEALMVADQLLCNAKQEEDELDEIDREKHYDNEPEEEFKIYPIGGREAADAGTISFDMPVSDYQIVTDNIGTSNEYLDAWVTPVAGYQIEFVVISYESDGTTPDMWTARAYYMDEAGQRGNLIKGKDGIDREDIYEHYLGLIAEYEQAQADQIIAWQNHYQGLIDDEEARLRAEVTTTTEQVEQRVDYEMTTKELYVNKGDFLSEFTIKGDWWWPEFGEDKILYLNDDDTYTSESGAVKIVFNTEYYWDVRIGFEGQNTVDYLERLGWAEQDNDYLDLEDGDEKGAIADHYTAAYLNGVLSMEIKGNGGFVEIDVDKTSGNGIAGFYIGTGGRTYQLTNWKIDDEVAINISNPWRFETVEITTTTNALGEVVTVDEEDISPDPEPPEDDGDGIDDEFTPHWMYLDDEKEWAATYEDHLRLLALGYTHDKPESNWGWWILGGIVVIAFGVILWKMTRPVSQNRPVSSGSVPPSNPPPTAPVVVNVEGGGGA